MSLKQIIDEHDLGAILEIEPKSKEESNQDFILRILQALSDVDIKIWFAFPQRIRTWYNRCRKELDKDGDPIPFPLYRKNKRANYLGYNLRDSATTRLVELILLNGDISNAEILKKLQLEGWAVSEATVKQVAGIARRVLRIIKTYPTDKED